MKQITLAAFFILASIPAFAASHTMTGKISDSMCGLTHKAMIEHANGKLTDAQCTEACVKNGAKYVFTSGGKVYNIANQDEKDLAANAGKTVQVTGDLEGSTITVQKVAASSPKKTTQKN
jgi:hypothetical protein